MPGEAAKPLSTVLSISRPRTRDALAVSSYFYLPASFFAAHLLTDRCNRGIIEP